MSESDAVENKTRSWKDRSAALRGAFDEKRLPLDGFLPELKEQAAKFEHSLANLSASRDKAG